MHAQDTYALVMSLARSKQILTGQARKWAGQRGVSGSSIIIQNYQNDISYEQPID